MKVKRMNKATLAWLGGFLLLMASCSDDENGFPPAEAYRYTAVVSDQNTFQVDLPNLSGIASISESPYWFNAQSTADSDKSVTITVTKEKGEEYRCDSVRVDGVAGDHAFVVVEQAGTNPIDDDDNAEITDPEHLRFLTDWENMEEITVQGEVLPTPWIPTNETSLPPTVSDVKKEDGWEMAFTSIHGKARNTYFGVYNKYLGILRIFDYHKMLVSSGSEWVFKSYIEGGAKPATYHALYNSLLYGIPASHTGVEESIHYDTSFRLKGAGMLTQAVNPYGGQDGQPPRVSVGWTAFDIDMSHYRPTMYADGQVDEVIYSGRDVLITLNQSNSYTQSTLYGNLVMESSGNLSGKMTMTTTNANGLNAWAAWQSITGGGSDFINGLMHGDYLGALVGGGSALYNGAMLFSGRKQDHYESEGTFTGSLTMDTSGTLGLDGFSISANGSANDLRVGLAQETEISKSHLGKGVWSLIDDPVIYVVKDYIAGYNTRFVTYVGDQAHTYNTSTDPAQLGLQLITCPDPSSLKGNLSPVFKDVKNVNISWTWGVYSDYGPGHSTAFRETALKLPMPSLALDSTHNAGNSYTPYSDREGVMRYKKVTAGKGKLYSLLGKKLHVWGEPLTGKTVYGNDCFIQSPAIYVPFTKNDSYMLYDPIIPDLVVGVIVTFDFMMDGKEEYQRAVISKRFLPKVQPISLDELKKKMNSKEMEKYMEKNAKVDGVGYPTAEQVMAPSLDILKQL